LITDRTLRAFSIAVAMGNEKEALYLCQAVSELGMPVEPFYVHGDRELVECCDRGVADMILIGDDFGSTKGRFTAHLRALHRLKDPAPAAVVCHSKDSYCAAAEARAEDAMPASFDGARLRSTVERLMAMVPESSRVIEMIDCLEIDDGAEVHYARYSDISVVRWSSKSRNKVEVYTMDGPFLWSRTMEEARRELHPKGFVMVSRNAVVNLEAVLEVMPENSRRIKLKMPFMSEPVTVSKSLSKEVAEALALTGRFKAEDFSGGGNMGVFSAGVTADFLQKAMALVKGGDSGQGTLPGNLLGAF